LDNIDWPTLIFQMIWIFLLILLFTGGNQKIQMKLWSIDIRNKLKIIRKYLEDDQRKIENYMRNLGMDAPSILVKRIINYFTIEPVDIEPTDIIKRMDHLIQTSERTIKKIIADQLPDVGVYERSLVETGLAIISVINSIYKVVLHYLLTSEKEHNWVLLMQLQLIMPQILRLVETYHESLDPFLHGKPIGDTAGAYVAYRLVEEGEIISHKIVEDTSIFEVRLDDRRIYVIKAKGPGSNVGRPGIVLAQLVEELKGNVDLVITVDAALKLEGEKRGEIAEGVGAAIGDPGPEKIAIERATTKYGIPLKALVIKMGLDDAINAMKKEIYEACERTYEYVRKLIKEMTKPSSTVIVAGIGNTIGVP